MRFMGSGMELDQAIYQFYLTQIQFGIYQYGEKLPALEETCRQFHTSLDTAGPAYHRLKQEGYISISKKSGARTIVTYEPHEIELHIQTFYADRKESLIDLSSSVWPLLGQAQCYALKYGSLEPADLMELSNEGTLLAPQAVWKLLDRKYSSLGNELLMRLTRYLYLYFYGSFWSVIGNKTLHEKTLRQLQTAEALCSKGKWEELPDVMRVVQDEFSHALRNFFNEKIYMQPSGKEAVFCWDAYKKSSQLRYTLAMELLTEISRGAYPAESYLPSAERLSAAKGVSVSTVRRAVCLLNSIGAVKSTRPLGARVLPSSRSAENCDFTQPDYRRRLLDLVESMQIFALSGKAVSELTLASLDEASLCQWKQYLCDLKSRGHCEQVIYAALSLVKKHAPFQTLRTIYSELLRLLFWGYPLQGMLEMEEPASLFLFPCFEQMLSSLEQNDITSFSATLERLLFHELRRIVDVLLKLGIHEVGKVLIPEAGGHQLSGYRNKAAR